MPIKKVGVAGSGLMGSGIAQVSAQSGCEVVISDVNQELVNEGLASIDKVLSGRVEKGKMSPQDKDAILGRIKGTTDLNEFSRCELVIEAITENMETKRELFGKLDKICPPQTLLATNTSILSVIKIASATSEETLAAGKEFGESIGKTVILAKDTPGFIVNKLYLPFILSAVRMLESGVATKEDIDNGVQLGLNFPMGPLVLSDMLGVDTLYYIACSIYEEIKDPQFAPPPLLGKMVDAGWHGRKTGRGFYQYDKSA